MDELFCSRCGQEVVEEARWRYCPRCGVMLAGVPVGQLAPPLERLVRSGTLLARAALLLDELLEAHPELTGLLADVRQEVRRARRHLVGA